MANQVVHNDPFEISVAEFQKIYQEGRFEVLGADGFQPVGKFFDQGVKSTILINGTSFTPDHQVQLVNSLWVRADMLEIGSLIKGELGAIEVTSIEPGSDMPVYDIEVLHENHRFFADQMSVHNCTSAQEVRHITKVVREKGIEHWDDIQSIEKSTDPVKKLFIEVEIEPGRYSRINPVWLRHAVNRAVMKATEGRLVDSLIYGKYQHTRQFNSIKKDDSPEFIGGKVLMLMYLNGNQYLRDSDMPALLEKAQGYVTKGWKINDIRLKSAAFQLKNACSHVLIEYRINSDKIPDISSFEIKEKIDLINKGYEVKYKAFNQVAQGVYRTETKSLAKNQIMHINALPGDTTKETVVKVYGSLVEVNPMALLCGILGVNKEGPCKPRNFNAVYSVSTNILGYYFQEEGASEGLFSIVESDSVDNQEGKDTCSICSSIKPINIYSEKPFGSLPYERHSLLEEGACPACFIKMTN